MLLNLLIVLALILANGIFAMSELSIVSARKVRLEQLARKGDRKAQAALNLANRPNDFFSTVQVGITLITLLSGVFGEKAISEPIKPLLANIPAIAPYADTLAFLIAISTLTYVSLILGELVPKQLALTMPESIAKVVAGPMRRLSRLTAPMVALLSFSTKTVITLLGIRPSTEPSVTQDELRAFIQQGTQEGTLEEAEQEMLERVLKLGDRRVNEIMTPRPEIIWLDLEDSVEENQEKIATANYRRLPVCQRDLDKVLGLVNVNNLLTRSLQQEPLDLTVDLEQPLVVPERMRSLLILERFKQTRIHTALVVDEYGVIQGLVTLGDILEALVGDVASADDQDEDEAQQREDGSWLIDGLMDIDDAHQLLGFPADEVHGSYQTIGGFMVHHLGRVPKAADKFKWQGFEFEVMDMDGNRVDKVLVHQSEKAPEATTD
jgi:putative hemolysin